MSLPQFTDILSLSNAQISEAIIETESKLFNLRFKKATRQNLKSHEIKYTKQDNFNHCKDINHLDWGCTMAWVQLND